jgi:cytochrome P460
MAKYFLVFVALGLCASARMVFSAEATVYTASGDLVFPSDYREWVFLTSSLDLNYNEAVPGAGRQSLLDNVFVNPDAYRAFLKTGAWPDKTVFVKENRTAVSAGSIAKSGKFQAGVASAEFHVKDETRYPGKWAFFVSDGKSPGRLMPPSAACYSCHLEHGATDTTFVQFYPTLIEVAKSKGVFDASR